MKEMVKTMIEWLVPSLTSVLCVVLGFVGDRWLSSLDKRPKLYFSMCSTPDEMVDDYDIRTKYSSTEYSVEIFNMGTQPIILETFSLEYKEMTIPCVVADEDRIIPPYKNIRYILNQQEADSLMHWCKKYEFKKCNVAAYCIDGKKVKSTLEVPLIHIRASFARQVENA